MSLSDHALITLDDYKQFVNIDADNQNVNDSRIEFFINVVSDMFRRYTDRNWRYSASATTEIRDGDGETNMFLNNKPIVTVTSIAYWDGDSWVVQSVSTYPYTYVTETGEVYFTDGDTFWSGKKNWRVIYTHGYAIAAVPYDIKQSVAQMVQRLLLKANSKEGLSSETTETGTTSYNLASIPQDVALVWDRNRRRVF